MVKSEWSIRIEKVDGPTRRSSFRYGDRTAYLPLIFDVGADPTGNALGRGIPISQGWDGIEISIRNDPENESIFETRLNEILIRMKITNMPRAVAFNRISIDSLMDGERIGLPVTILPLSPLIFTDMMVFSEAVGDMISGYPARPPLYIPGGTDGENLEVLFYLGAELFDTTRIDLDSSLRYYYTDSGRERLDDILKYSSPADICGCRACTRSSEAGSPDDMDPDDLQEHNLGTFRRRLNRCIHHLERGDLRNHVMGIMADKPGYSSLLRAVEVRHLEAIAPGVPSWRKSAKRLVAYRDDLRSPEFELWRRDLMDHYGPLPHKDILLLLPCSARKPYSSSRTHMRIRDSLSGVKGWRDRIQIVVMTSPLGAVPMELESLYPAAYYDIPVTGNWYPEEVERIRELVVDIHEKGHYNHVISYHGEGKEFFPIPSDYFGATTFRDVFGSSRMDAVNPGKALRDHVSESMEGDWTPPEFRSDLLEALNCVNFSLSCDIKPRSGMKIWRDRRNIFIRESGRNLFDMRIGGPVPTLDGGRMIWNASPDRSTGRFVMIDDFVPRGTVFNQGITSVRGRIRPGDIVIVGHEDDFRGVGRSLQPGEILASDVGGPGVKMISHVK
ncbi:MAG: DUF5591 domain-containing protein [Thermoplasmatota archaeon]